MSLSARISRQCVYSRPTPARQGQGLAIPCVCSTVTGALWRSCASRSRLPYAPPSFFLPNILPSVPHDSRLPAEHTCRHATRDRHDECVKAGGALCVGPPLAQDNPRSIDLHFHGLGTGSPPPVPLATLGAGKDVPRAQGRLRALHARKASCLWSSPFQASWKRPPLVEGLLRVVQGEVPARERRLGPGSPAQTAS